jgi:hypothetical protein
MSGANTMKDSMDAAAVGRAVDPEVFANRKLIRPALNRNDHPHTDGERRERIGDRADRGDRSNGKKTPPPEQTHAENFYYQKQMQTKTPMVLVLRRRGNSRRHRVVRQILPQGESHRCGEPADLQAQHQVHVQRERSNAAAEVGEADRILRARLLSLPQLFVA